MPCTADNALECYLSWPGQQASCCMQGIRNGSRHCSPVLPCCMQGIREMGFAGLGLPKDLEQWRQRVQWVADHITPSPVPDLSHSALMAGLETWLAPHLMGCRSKAQLQGLNWSVILRSALQAVQAWRSEFRVSCLALSVFWDFNAVHCSHISHVAA